MTSFEDVRPSLHPSILYMCGQREISPTTLKEHWQFFVHFKEKRRFKFVQSLFPKCHIEACKGSLEDNIKYCSKETTSVVDTFFEFGEKPKNGRPKLESSEIIKRLKVQSPTKVLDADPSLWRSVKQLQLIASMFKACRNYMPYVYYFYGKPGSGKTRTASLISSFLGETYYKPAGKWWDGYNQQPCCIIDDVHTNEISTSEFKRVADRYPYKVEYKGGFMEFNSPVIFLTSNFPYQCIWPNQPDYTWFSRRVVKVLEYY